MESALKGAYQMALTGIEYAGVGEGKKGVYLLSNGERSRNNRLFVTYVGATNNLRQSLIAKMGENNGYQYFWYEEAVSEKEAREKASKYLEIYKKVHAVSSNLDFAFLSAGK